MSSMLAGTVRKIVGTIADNVAAFVTGTDEAIPTAWLYKIAVPKMTDGRAGIPRMSVNRVPLATADYREDNIGDDSVPLTDIVVNTSDLISGVGGAVTPTTAWFTAAEIGAGTRYIYIPMAGWPSAKITVFKSLSAATTVTLVGLSAAANDTVAISAGPIKIDEVTLGATDGTFQQVTFGMYELGAAGSPDTLGTTGGSCYRKATAIGGGWHWLALKITTATDPAAGVFRARVQRSSL